MGRGGLCLFTALHCTVLRLANVVSRGSLHFPCVPLETFER